MPDYRKLRAWQRSHQLVLQIYNLTRGFPAAEKFELVNQIRRAALSVPMNLAEGAGRDSDSDYRRFVAYSLGSLNELEYQLLVSRELGFGAADAYPRLERELSEIRAMLTSLRHRLGHRKGS